MADTASSSSAGNQQPSAPVDSANVNKQNIVIEFAQPNQPPLVLKPNDPRLKFCDFFKKFQSAQIDAPSDAGGAEESQATLPDTITPVLMEHIRKWSAYHDMLNVDNDTDSEDEQLTEPERLVKEYLPSTKIPAFDEIYFQRMDMRTRLELMNACDFLGCDKLLDNMAKFIAKKMTRKTPEAIRKMFGITHSGFTEEEERQWKEKFGWALIGCSDEVEENDCVKPANPEAGDGASGAAAAPPASAAAASGSSGGGDAAAAASSSSTA